MALIQDTHVNMPFQSWELRPRDVNHTQLTIIAAVVEVEIQIKVLNNNQYVYAVVCEPA
jgi:cancer susceptibility candidate protein 1